MIYVTKPTLPLLSDYVKYLKGIWERDWLTNNGPLVQELESKLEKYLGVKNLSVVANATLGISIVCEALKLKGEVITTPFTFAATTNALVLAGATPVFADIDPHTFNIDTKDVERKITKRTTAIFAVHVFGNPCDVKELQRIASKYNLKLIYDAAHAFGVEHEGKSICEYGDASILSFHAVKLFNTVEGGAIITKDIETSDLCKLYRNFGIASEESVVLPGLNAKMSEFHAAMGLCNLKTIEKAIKLNKKHYDLYVSLLGSSRVRFQKQFGIRKIHTYMPVCFEDKETRDLVHDQLLLNNFSARKYFYPLTSSFEYLHGTDLKKKGTKTLANATNVADTVLCLPMYPTLSSGDIKKICAIIKQKC